jgi:hypothetical protein
MTTSVTTVDIFVEINNANFRCSSDLTVEQAVGMIRSRYGIRNGGITLGGVVQDLEVKVGDMKEDGELRFVGGQCPGNPPCQWHRLSNYPPSHHACQFNIYSFGIFSLTCI